MKDANEAAGQNDLAVTKETDDQPQTSGSKQAAATGKEETTKGTEAFDQLIWLGILPAAPDDIHKYDLEALKRKSWPLQALGMLLIGVLLAYAPQYVQSNMPWITIGSEILCLLFLVGSIKTFYDIYPRLFTRGNILLVALAAFSIFLYTGSEPGKSYMNVPEAALSRLADFDIMGRVMSFMALVILIGFLLFRIPGMILFYERHKQLIRATILSKKSFALIVGVLSVVTALGTALLQIIQIVSQLLHL